jgi:hypothetical protein
MPKSKRTIRKPKISCKRKYGMKTCRRKRRKRSRGQGAAQRPVSRKRSRNRSRRHVGGAGEGGPNSPMICESTMFTETCRVKRCDLENIDVQIGDPYRILNLSRHTLRSIHFYAEITNPRKKCVYVFGLTRGTGVGFRGNGAALMIHDAKLSKVSKDNGLKTGEILTKKDINKIMGEETSDIDHLQKSIIDIFIQRSIIYTYRGKNHSRIAYFDVPFDLLGICFADIPGNYNYQIHEPSTVNCRKGAVLFHYQPFLLLQMVEEHLVNHNEPGHEPDFEPTIANKATSLPKYEYSRELLAEEARVAAEEAEAAEETFFDAEETFFDVEESFTGEPPPSHPSSSEKQGKSTIRLEEGVPPLASEKVASPARSADPVSPVTSPGV